jgi:fibronectin type 3 domain-containing protein
METPERYSDYIHLDKNFKEVFNLEDDADKDLLWKRFIFTVDFKKMLEDISFIFSEERVNERKGILLTGKYGVGKSHATAVLSHLLWDDFDSIKDTLKRAKDSMAETGSGLYLFRQEKRYFPVILSAHDSGEIEDAKSFEYRLQIALESALKRYGYLDKITSSTEFEKYSLWLQQMRDDPEKQALISIIGNDVQKSTAFADIDELLEALHERDIDAINLIKNFFKKYDIPPPRHCDTRGYYTSVLADLKKCDPAIQGIIIYWDEFTTVFNAAGKFNDANLIDRIQTWAEKAESGIYLFLVSHLSPEALRGRYQLLDDTLAKINDRLCVTDIRMDKNTTYNLIAESLSVNDREALSSFLNRLGFSLEEYTQLQTLGRRVFGDAFQTDEQVIKRTIPLHLYSVYVAAKIADLVGSAERSIFTLIHSEDQKETPYGKKIGFQYFLDHEPAEGKLVWYTIDQVFDFFYEDLAEHEFDPVTEANVIKPINAFKQYYPVAQQMGDEGVRVFKAIALLEMLYAEAPDPALLPSLKNLKNVFAMTDVSDVKGVLDRMVEKPLIISYEDEMSGSIVYKTMYSGYDDEEKNKIKKELLKNRSFEKFILENTDDIRQKVIEHVTDAPRISSGNCTITALPANDIPQRKQIKNLDDDKNLNIIVCIPESPVEFDHARRDILSLSKNHKNAIFTLYEGSFVKRYDRWLNACAFLVLGQRRSNRSMISEADREVKTEVKRFLEDLERVTIFFRGETVTKTNGLGNELSRYIEQIYPLGFDHLSYNQFWSSPKKYSRDIADNYGQPNGCDGLERNNNSIIKRILDLFSDKRGNRLVDARLILKQDETYVVDSPLYIIVTKIRTYIRENNGKWLSLRKMIDDLELERPPYGLCGWIESLVLSYALAEFIEEGRLEVMAGNQTPTKDTTKIVESINAAIKSDKNDSQIRYGRIIENKVAKKLIGILKLNIDAKSALPDVLHTTREMINAVYGLPLWTIPMAFKEDKQKDLEKIINPLNQLLLSDEKEYSEDLLDTVLERIKDTEFSYTMSIWDRIFSKDTTNAGFRAFVNFYFPRLLSSYPGDDDLVFAVKKEVKEDPWTWEKSRISDVLARLNRTIDPPEQPRNVHTSRDAEGVHIVWDSPSVDSPQPDTYDILRSEYPDQCCTYLERINATATRYCDTTAEPGKTYCYQIVARNAAGESQPSEIVRQKILLPPPQLPVTVSSDEDFVNLTWTLPEPAGVYDITQYEICVGESPKDVHPVTTLPASATSYQDYNIESGKSYYFQLIAKNSDGEKGKGVISGPARLLANVPPEAPRDATAILQRDGIEIRWSHPKRGIESVDDYCIYRSDESGNIASIYTGNSKATSFIDDTALPGKTYRYGIVARNNAGESAWTETKPVHIFLEIPPVRLNIVDLEGKAHLHWDILGEEYEIERYEVRKGDHPGNLQPLCTFGSDTNEYIDDRTRPGHIYYYELIVINKGGSIRKTDIPVKFAPKLSIDINKWEEETREFAKSNPDLFISRLMTIFRSISNGNASTSSKELEKIACLLEYLEGLSDARI